jgi:hypothetical protein
LIHELWEITRKLGSELAGAMRWVSGIVAEYPTAFVRSAAHTLVTSDVSYRDGVAAKVL